ncbi:7-carboxy-7-deazaguanine synthase [Hydrocarboniclastica marina]|uniref:7-carboxy-7-deazaguanine synthase n=1 Tax=Hydrocarboniclastica marina TaxID=2259620 RepID=A0A4P7XFN5_9ALTE|nr:7-carboxy-7-deazaguanine synthase [Hydrocarboniclastica marina]MAL97932.1 7-carboxy-7-deazaguanine synthase [Alteromonadaceae bacterium]QCF24547.1 7-carboxy-7-deazaguanine synthase [Hydrocarboniclastica marina]|tara:strand:- start:4029 stop:4709 length:681 start_codon:yes stop_codon:yes gene_type:complete
MYRVKEMFYTLQGEGAQTGRPAVFCRFSKCNLWNGREKDRANSICSFCDTDFVGTDGQNGGEFADAMSLAKAIADLWPASGGEGRTRHGRVRPYVVCTGGEPLLQLDVPLIDALHGLGFEVGVETNGTLPAPAGVDWLCVSPKAAAVLAVTRCDELKLVYPQAQAMPERFSGFDADYFYLSPMASPDATATSDPLKWENTRRAIEYCLEHPQWRLTLQTHKLVGID